MEKINNIRVWFIAALAIVPVILIALNYVAYLQCKSYADKRMGKSVPVLWAGFSFSATHIVYVSFTTPKGPESVMIWRAKPYCAIDLMQ